MVVIVAWFIWMTRGKLALKKEQILNELQSVLSQKCQENAGLKAVWIYRELSNMGLRKVEAKFLHAWNLFPPLKSNHSDQCVKTFQPSSLTILSVKRTNSLFSDSNQLSGAQGTDPQYSDWGESFFFPLLIFYWLTVEETYQGTCTSGQGVHWLGRQFSYRSNNRRPRLPGETSWV